MTLHDILEPAVRGWGIFYLITGLWLLFAGIASCLMGRAIHAADQAEHVEDPLAAWEPLFHDVPTVPLSRAEMDEFDALMGGAK